jgi:hypothetical protein
MKQIIVTVTPEGEVQIEAVGFKGNACESATKAIEQALGVKKGFKKKPEYYASNTTTQRIGG